MKNLALKIFAALAALALVVASFWNYSEIRDYYLTAAVILIYVVGFNFVLVRRLEAAATRYLFLILPPLLVIGFFVSQASISSIAVKGVFVLLVAALYYFYQITPSQQRQLFLDEPITLVTAFLALWSIWSFNFFFLPKWILIILLTFGCFFLLYLQIFYKVGRSDRGLLLLSLGGGLVMAELAWATLYWPVHFFTAAVTNFVAFYGIYSIGSDYFSQRLTKKRIYFQVAIMSIILFLVLVSSPWQP